MLGYFVGWHQWDVEVLTSRAHEGRYVSLPEWWQDWEVPSGLWAFLGPSLLYLSYQLITDEGSTLWMVVVAEWIASVAMFLVWEAYHTCRSW